MSQIEIMLKHRDHIYGKKKFIDVLTQILCVNTITKMKIYSK